MNMHARWGRVVFLCSHVFFLCLCGFSLGAAVSSHSQNICCWANGLKLPVVLNEKVFLSVSCNRLATKSRMFPCLLLSALWVKDPVK